MRAEQSKLMYELSKEFGIEVSAQELFENEELVFAIYSADNLLISTKADISGIEVLVDNLITIQNDSKAYKTLLQLNDFADRIGTSLCFRSDNKGLRDVFNSLGYKEIGYHDVSGLWRYVNLDKFKAYNGFS